jgi:hypothetical protein
MTVRSVQQTESGDEGGRTRGGDVSSSLPSYARGKRQPSVATMERWEFDRGLCRCPDGCWTELDGTCPHGQESWFTLIASY